MIVKGIIVLVVQTVPVIQRGVIMLKGMKNKQQEHAIIPLANANPPHCTVAPRGIMVALTKPHLAVPDVLWMTPTV